MANHNYERSNSGTLLASPAGYRLCVSIAKVSGIAAICGLVLVACGGGGGGTPSRPSSTPTPAAALPQHIHVVIGFSSGRTTENIPGSDAPVLPSGTSDGGPLPGAIVVYPDGSTQVADGTGSYDPSKSSYAIKYQRQLQSNAMLQPTVMILDPSSAALPSAATVSAYASARTSQVRMVQSTGTARGRFSIGTATNIAAVALLPQSAALIDGNMLALDAVGIDTNNNVLDISQAQITWTAQYGSVLAFPNSSQAYYIPPQVPSGSVIDSVTASVSVNGQTPFSSTNYVTVISQASSANASGKLSDGSAPIAKGVAVFAQAGLPQFFSPSYLFAQADQNGSYSAQLPANSLFSLGIGTNSAGNFGVYVANGPSGSTSYRSLAAGASDSLDLTLASPAVPFSLLPPALQANLPSWVTFVRDAWFGTSAFSRRVFEASSGIQPLLANAPQTLSAPTPANPVPVGSGQLAKWCYQWQPVNGTPTLTLIENTDTSCTQPGNEAITVNASPSGGYTYVKYYSHTPYVITGTPDVSNGALLVASGSWTQSVTTDSSGNVQSDQAAIQSQLYDEADQVFGQPVYNESLSYQYTVGSNGMSTARFSNDQRVSAYDGSLVASFNGTKTQVGTYGPGGCTSTGSACHTVNANVQEDGFNYTINGTQNGDGSASYTYENSTPGDSSKIALGMVSDTASNSQGCVVCASQPGTIYDTDGTTPIGTFTISDAGLVQVSIYDTPPGSAALGPDVIDTLAFVL